MQRRNRISNRKRSGALTVEFAMTLPIVFSIFIASIEFSRLNVIRNSADNAAYEGAREGALPGATLAKVRQATGQSLRAVGIRNAQVTVNPSVITSATQTVTVRVAIPLRDNAWVSPLYSTNRMITRECRLTRETALQSD